MQFLDQTVSLRRLGIRWTVDGVRLRRAYRFDYSCEGVVRQSGRITLIGTRLEAIVLEGSCKSHDSMERSGQPSALIPRANNVVPLRPPPPRDEG